MIALLIYAVGFMATAAVSAVVTMKQDGKKEMDVDIAMISIFFGMCWPVLVPFAMLAWSLKEGVNKVLREVRKHD